MTLVEIQRAVDRLSPNDRKRLAHYLRTAEQEEQTKTEVAIQRRLADSNPESWISMKNVFGQHEQ